MQIYDEKMEHRCELLVITVVRVMSVTTINGAQIYHTWCKKKKAETFMESVFQFLWCARDDESGRWQEIILLT